MTLTELPFDFPGRIFRSPMPFSHYDPLDELWPAYQKADVDVVIVLTEPREYLASTQRDLLAFYRGAGLDVIPLPIPDFQTPTNLDAFGEAIQKVVNYAEAGRNVAVHCLAGLGRTGIFLACLARQRFGFSGPEAVDWVRTYIPSALENQAQMHFVGGFQAL